MVIRKVAQWHSQQNPDANRPYSSHCAEQCSFLYNQRKYTICSYFGDSRTVSIEVASPCLDHSAGAAAAAEVSSVSMGVIPSAAAVERSGATEASSSADTASFIAT